MKTENPPIYVTKSWLTALVIAFAALVIASGVAFKYAELRQLSISREGIQMSR